MKEQNNQYIEMGKGIKEGMKGLNTVASPKKKSICSRLLLLPVIGFVFTMIGAKINFDIIMYIGTILILLSGTCCFYVGRFKKGLLYTFTCGLFLVGILLDLFTLNITGTYKDANGFPVIY